MIAATVDELLVRAAGVLAAMPESMPDRVEIASMTSAVGGGSLPGETLESVGLRIVGNRPAALAARLRGADPPVIARVEAGAVWLDLRTIDPAEDAALAGGDRPGHRRGEDRMTVVIGTAGHIDHGKTTLLLALTGIDADRLPEERRRGMTIDVGYAHLRLPDGTELDFVDVPGHDRLVGNMLVGAGEIDAAMLVVAADDGPRAQTIEHLALLDALEIRHGVAVVTKADVAGPARTGRGRGRRRAAARGHDPCRLAGPRRLVGGWRRDRGVAGRAGRPARRDGPGSPPLRGRRTHRAPARRAPASPSIASSPSRAAASS